MDLLFTIVALLAIGLAMRLWLRYRRRKHLIAKYGDASLVALIMKQQISQGMTTEQLIDSWGRPNDIEHTIYKTKTKHTYKYGRTGKNRFSNRVFVENGLVVGWQGRK
jgi:hypothetical protein